MFGSIYSLASLQILLQEGKCHHSTNFLSFAKLMLAKQSS